MEALFRSHVDGAVRTACMITHNWHCGGCAGSLHSAFRSLGTFRKADPLFLADQNSSQQEQEDLGQISFPLGELDQQVPDNST